MFGCYVQAAETETSNSYDISDKQKKVYDKLYGEGNWTIDDNGLVSPTKNYEASQTQMQDRFNEFMMGILLRCSVLAPFASDIEDFNDRVKSWFNKNDDSIDVSDDGNITIKSDAMQDFRNALSDQVYGLGCYKILSSNITIPELQKKMKKFCNDKYPSSMDYYLNHYPNIFSGYYTQGTKEYMSFIYFPDSYFDDSDSYCFLLNPDFDNTKKGVYWFGKYSLSSGNSRSLRFIGDSRIDSACYCTYITVPGDPVGAYISYLGSDFMYTGATLKVFSSLESANFYYNSLFKKDYKRWCR